MHNSYLVSDNSSDLPSHEGLASLQLSLFLQYTRRVVGQGSLVDGTEKASTSVLLDLLARIGFSNLADCLVQTAGAGWWASTKRFLQTTSGCQQFDQASAMSPALAQQEVRTGQESSCAVRFSSRPHTICLFRLDNLNLSGNGNLNWTGDRR